LVADHKADGILMTFDPAGLSVQKPSWFFGGEEEEELARVSQTQGGVRWYLSI